MKQQDQIIAEQLKKQLSSIIEVLDMRVFGSRAMETNDEYSDMDVFIEIEIVTKEVKNKIYETAWEIGFENNIVISPLIFTKDEIINSPLRASSIVKNIFQHGISI